MKPCRCDLVECTGDTKQTGGGFIDVPVSYSTGLTWGNKENNQWFFMSLWKFWRNFF